MRQKSRNRNNMKRFILAIFTVLCFGFIFSSNTYAIDDVVLTLDASNANLVGICHNTNPSSSLSGHACTDFNYLILTPSSSFSSHSPYFMIGDNKIYADSMEAIISLDSSTNYSIFSYNVSSLPSGWSISVTLSESYGGSCPEPEPPVPCEDPEENSRYINVVIDAFWKYHIGFAGAAASILAIFFVYRIIKGRIR